MTIQYEWAIETVDAESDDIIDQFHQDRLYDFGIEAVIQAINQDYAGNGNYTRLVLVRDVMDDGGVKDRSWAYVTDDGKMPEQFLDAYDRPVAKVPKRFIEEFNS